MAVSTRAEVPARAGSDREDCAPALSWPLLLGYGLLGFPLAALNLPLYVYLPAFYASELGLGLTTIGVVLFAARLLDTVSDPLIGELSDRTPTPIGKRRPWILAAAPLLLLSSYLLFMPGQGVGALYLLVWTSVAYLAWTMMILPYVAWGAELSSDYHERSRITAAREVCVIFGILFASALPVLLAGGQGSADEGATLAGLFWIMLVCLPIGLLALMAGTPEIAHIKTKPLRLREGIEQAWANGPFRRLVAAYFLNGIANGLPATLFLLFVEHVLQAKDQAGPLLFLYFLSGVLAVPFWLWLSRRTDKHRAWCYAMLWACIAFSTVPLLGAGDVHWFFAICLASGVSLGADLALPSSMQADVVDLDRLRTGRRRTGLFFALWSMTTKLSLAFAVGFAFPVLGLLGFEASGDNGALALFGLSALYGLAPLVIKLGAVALVWHFPLDAAAQRDIQQRLQGATAPA
ncbi:MAG: MFS transporter [Geminicoccaceae bacterium]